jgi:formylglycine-generating enzyme required for sulfatase activity
MLFLSILSTFAQETVSFPADTFQQGSDFSPDESPKHAVSLSPYQLDTTEVSIKEFEQFVSAGWSQDKFWTAEGLIWRTTNPQGAGAQNRSAGRASAHPVVAVSWFEADAYCHSKGGRLPTEAEWERAACNGQKEGRFAWGDDEMMDAAWYSSGKYGHLQAVLTKTKAETPAEQLTKDGLYHTTGNVWEWTADWYHAEYYQKQEAQDPTGPDSGVWKTLRGGSFMNLPSYCSCTHREPARPDRVAYTTGFRCAFQGER